MELIFKVVGIGLAAALIIAIIKQSRAPEATILISLVAGTVIFILMVDKISAVLNILQELSTRASINLFYMAILFKIIGIAYIAEFGAQVCRDAGEGAIAAKVEFAAKILVMVVAIPIIAAILESIIRLLP